MHVQSLKTRITTPLFAETVAWYRDLLGLETAEQWEEPGDKGRILTFPNGRGEAYLEIYDGPTGDFAGLSLQFRTTDIDAFHREIADRFDSRGPIDRPWGSRYLYLTDPNGVQVIIFSGGL
jgi:catechol 2,3-dioxygenase-like lactoylglutathione lyase family enzyme